MASIAPSTLDQPKLASNAKFPMKRSPQKGHPFNKTKNVPRNDKSLDKATPQPLSVPIRSSKPIINWFQRKLAGTGRAKRAAADVTTSSKSRTLRGASRVVSSPVPQGGKQLGPLDAAPSIQRKTISLNEEDFSLIGGSDGNSLNPSLDPESSWSPGSVLEADEDASLRPIPPSSPPSPSPSHSSSSYLSDPRTFRSIAASTKPTTVLSLDIHGNGNGMAHIAEAPTTPPNQYRFPPHIRATASPNHTNSGSGASVTFSALPQSSSRSSSSAAPGSLVVPQTTTHGGIAPVQAPLHTAHHPRNNPRPSSPPLDNASVLTLASSAYAVPGLRPQLGHSASPSTRGIGDPLSHGGGSITYPDAESASHFILGYDERLEERDVDASVRALRPRSSRRGSWESEASRWSARDQLGAVSLIRDRSLRTSFSLKIGPRSPGPYDRPEDIEKPDEKENSLQSSIPDSAYVDAIFEAPPSPAETHQLETDSRSSVDLETQPISPHQDPPVDKTPAKSFESAQAASVGDVSCDS